MCGRYRLSRRKQLIEEYFEAASVVDWEPRFNIAPSQNVGIVRQDAARPRREFSLARWGMIPYWAKDPTIGQRMINARSETVGDKPAFRDPFRYRRCLVPADGFLRMGTYRKAQATFSLRHAR
jgi:putative SOS response-associated peptidase YedK